MKLKIKYLKGKLIYLRALEEKDINRNYLSWINNIEENYFIESSRFPKSKKALDEFYTKNLISRNSVMFAICKKMENISEIVLYHKLTGLIENVFMEE